MQNNLRFTISARLLGAGAAGLQFSAVLKSLPLLALLPVNITPLLLCGVVSATAWRIWRNSYYFGLGATIHFFLQAALALWLTSAGAWTSSSQVVAQKLLDIVIIGPAMTFVAFAIAADRRCFQAFAAATAAIGLAAAVLVPFGLELGFAKLGGPHNVQQIRVQYQIVGLAIAACGSVLAVRLFISPPREALLCSIGLFLLVWGGATTGGRAAFISLIASSFVAPAATMAAIGSRAAAIRLMTGGMFSFVIFFTFLFSFEPSVSVPITIGRLLDPLLGSSDVRTLLWRSAWTQSSVTGLGPAAFAPVTGLGDLRRWYPHNLWLESLVEGGIPGFLLFSGILFNSALTLITSYKYIPSYQFGVTTGFSCIGAAQMMTSTDLGNRMAWFWLALASGVSVRYDGNSNGERYARSG